MKLSDINSQVQVNKASSKIDNEDKKLKQACKDFEGVLTHYMLKSMRKTLSGDDIFGKSLGKDIYQSMYDEHLAREIANGENNLGVGDALYNDLKKDSSRPSGSDERVENANLNSLNHPNQIQNYVEK